MTSEGRGILSPVRLPVPPLQQRRRIDDFEYSSLSSVQAPCARRIHRDLAIGKCEQIAYQPLRMSEGQPVRRILVNVEPRALNQRQRSFCRYF